MSRKDDLERAISCIRVFISYSHDSQVHISRVLALANRFFGTVQILITLFATNRAMRRLRKMFFHKLLLLPKSFHDNIKSGWLVARNTGDMQYIYQFMSFALMVTFIFITAIGMAK